MYIIKSKKYLKDYQKKIIDKHLTKEEIYLSELIDALYSFNNLYELLNSTIKAVYKIEKKQRNLKEIYTARINRKLRLYMKPIGEYPYELIQIEEIEFLEIDDKHYKEG